MTQTRSSIGILHNWIKNYERMISPIEMNDSKSLFHVNLANFGYKGNKNNNYGNNNFVNKSGNDK